ncbi:MAG: uroporphyrinogen-III synthase [Microvirga sp.]
MRVLLLRPRRQAEATALRLESLGHAPLVAPLLRIDETAARPPGGSFAALVVTSANGVPALARFAEPLPVYAVGERTAALIRAAGFGDVTAEPDATRLAARIVASVRRGARVLHVAGRDRKPEPEASLNAAGVVVETFVAYEAVAAEQLPEALAEALRAGALDAALHYSVRTVETALALARAIGVEDAFLRLTHVCLSEEVAAPLRARGAARLTIAAEPDETSLFAALALCESAGAGGHRLASPA